MFREIGYADELGSGMRNTNKYTKLYSGGTPRFVEENTFEIIIPIENVPELQVGGNGTQEQIVELIVENPKITRKAIAEKLNISIRSLQRVLNSMSNVYYVESVLMDIGRLLKRSDFSLYISCLEVIILVGILIPEILRRRRKEAISTSKNFPK